MQGKYAEEDYEDEYKRQGWRDLRVRPRGGCWGTVGSCWPTSLLPRPHLLPADAPLWSMCMQPPHSPHLKHRAPCLHFSPPRNDGRTFPSRTFLLIRAMQTLGPAIGEWQVTGLSYSCYFPALRNTSELPLGPFYFLVIGCGLSVRWAVSSLEHTTNWTRYTDGSTVTSWWALIKPSPLHF